MLHVIVSNFFLHSYRPTVSGKMLHLARAFTFIVNTCFKHIPT